MSFASEIHSDEIASLTQLTDAERAELNAHFDRLEVDVDEMAEYFDDSDEYDHTADVHGLEFDGQPDEYTEWQDYMGGDDWDHGQFDGEW